MSKIKLNELTVEALVKNSDWADLLTLEKNIKKAVEIRKDKAKSEVMVQLEQISLMNGFSIDELFGTPVIVSKLKIKYRNTDNASEVWTGRGKTPVWLQKLLATGRQIDEFLV